MSSMRDYDRDTREDSAAYLADLDRQERHAALYGMSETDRVSGCRHDYRPNRYGGATCRYCLDTVQGEP